MLCIYYNVNDCILRTTVYLTSNICKLNRFWLFWFTCCRKILKWFGFPVFYAVLLCILTFWVPCCDVRYDFRIKEMFGSSLPPVVCRMAHVLFMLCVLFVFVLWCLTHIVLCFCYVFSSSCCQFLWIVHFWFLLRYSLMFLLTMSVPDDDYSRNAWCVLN